MREACSGPRGSVAWRRAVRLPLVRAAISCVSGSRGIRCSVYLLYWYKRTNSDAEAFSVRAALALLDALRGEGGLAGEDPEAHQPVCRASATHSPVVVCARVSFSESMMAKDARAQHAYRRSFDDSLHSSVSFAA